MNNINPSEGIPAREDLHTEFKEALSGLPGNLCDTLCDLFDNRPQNGTDMTHENHLIERAVESIKATFGKRAAAALFSGRNGQLPSTKVTPSSSADLELVTWLVIMEGKS